MVSIRDNMFQKRGPIIAITALAIILIIHVNQSSQNFRGYVTTPSVLKDKGHQSDSHGSHKPHKSPDTHESSDSHDSQNSQNAANATLGFGTIITISSEDTSDPIAWRQSGITAAANLTGMEVTIAEHREPTFKAIKALQTEGSEPHAKDNPSLAWFAHLDALEDFVNSPYETALVFEDDADWDVTIKKTLAPKSPTVAAIRKLTGSKLDPKEYSYGLNWDLLWLGHCGFDVQKDSKNITVHDQSVMDSSNYRAVLNEKIYRRLEPKTRVIVSQPAPMCTFAYAVTKRGAKKLLERRHKGGKGMDFSTSIGCRAELECLSVLPEVFHHHKKLGGGRKPQIVREGTEAEAAEPPRAFTQNIKHSARCNAEARLAAGVDPQQILVSGEEYVQCLPNEEDFRKYNQ